MTEARARLEGKRRDVERALDARLSGEDTVLLRAMRHAVLSGGKRFRPLLLLCAAERFGGEGGLALPFACGVELIHNYSLVHDDLPAMDDDDLRRGRPTVHKAFGESVAVLAGDALLTLAFEVMAGAPCPEALAGRKAEATALIARAAGMPGMIGGQILDIGFRSGDESEPAYEALTARKTGALIAAAAEAGAVLGGAPDADRARLASFGAAIGLAFQLRDDLDDAGQEGARAAFRPNQAAFLGPVRSRAKLAELLRSAREGLASAGLLTEELLALTRILEPPPSEGTHD